jgi:hypothetical protein
MSLLGYPEAITLPIQHNSPKHLRDDDGHDDGHDDGPDDGHEDAHDDVSLNCIATLFCNGVFLL